MTPEISAYIPYYNNSTTIRLAIEAILAQTHPVVELLVIDDGSVDPDLLHHQLDPWPQVTVIHQERNLGRGAARSRAMQRVQHELVLCCDATNCLDPRFVEGALPWFADPQVAGVFGRIGQLSAGSSVHRWRGRHLFKAEIPRTTQRGALLSTYGALVRRSAVLAVGNYDPQLRHSEDAELGRRLLAAGYDVVSDPSLQITSIAENTLAQVLERYWRWNAGVRETISGLDYLRLINYSIKVMARQDLQAGDLGSVPISLVAPHYQFWRSWWRRRRGYTQGSSRSPRVPDPGPEAPDP